MLPLNPWLEGGPRSLLHERIQAAGNIGLLLADSSSLSGTQANVYVTEIMKGTDPFKYEVTGLTVGIPNYVRIFA